MADAVKHPPAGSVASELRGLISALRTRKTRVFAAGFVLTFVACTFFIAFNPTYGSAPSPWLSNIVSSAAPVRSQFDSIFSNIFSNSSTFGTVWGFGTSPSSSIKSVSPPPQPPHRADQMKPSVDSQGNQTSAAAISSGNGVTDRNQTKESTASVQDVLVSKNQTTNGAGYVPSGEEARNATKGKVDTTRGSPIFSPPPKNHSSIPAADPVAAPPPPSTASSGIPGKENLAVNPGVSNFSVSLGEKTESVAAEAAKSGSSGSQAQQNIESFLGCDIFHGRWVEDESYPLYKAGSCPHIDESFNCYRNGRTDLAYQKLRWQPFGCNIPRLNGKDMLERLRGRRLVFVGDSLNRNMWESLVCILHSSVEDKSRVFEASGRHEFKTEGSYSFHFKDYNCSVEFFRSPFLVQEWEMPEAGGKKRETLRLDIIEKSSSRYKDADVIVFNTGHWWTHEKTSKGKDYYQEGNRVYGELKVIEAFHKALSTWARWVDANIDPRRTLVFFRGYSASHFSGGKWNSGGQCDHETTPIKNESYVTFYPPKMAVLEAVIHGMKTPVGYLNITRMTDYRKDGHPSIYRKKKLTPAERREPEKYQDCSHWCLPGVPDSWNELLYAQLLQKLK